MEKKVKINNACYDDFGKRWYEEGNDHPIALLRAENRARLPWINRIIEEHFGTSPLKILDVGCGGGLVCNELIKKGHAVTGVDLSLPSLEIAKERDSTKRVNYLEANALELPFENSTFDIVCSMDFLEHVEDPERAVKESSRVLKPNGLFFFHTFNRNFLSYLVIIKGVEWFVRKTPKNLHLYNLFIKPSELKEMGAKNGLYPGSLQGLSPKCSLPLLKMLLTRRVPPNLEFQFTSSSPCGYSGFFIKNIK